jgi:hypothetical protein
VAQQKKKKASRNVRFITSDTEEDSLPDIVEISSLQDENSGEVEGISTTRKRKGKPRTGRRVAKRACKASQLSSTSSDEDPSSLLGTGKERAAPRGEDRAGPRGKERAGPRGKEPAATRGKESTADTSQPISVAEPRSRRK